MGYVKLLVNGSINSQLLLLEIGFVQSANDHSLFIKSKGYVFLALLVYVDDMIIASNDMATVTDLKYALSERFKVRDLGPLKYFLGMEIARTTVGISICQQKHALELISKVGYLGCKPTAVPVEPNQLWRSNQTSSFLKKMVIWWLILLLIGDSLVSYYTLPLLDMI